MASEKKTQKKDTNLKNKNRTDATPGYRKNYIPMIPSTGAEQESTLFSNVSPSAKGKNTSSKKATAVINNENAFSTDYPVFLQIRFENIFDIFSSAIIKPRVYDEGRSFTDVQNINPSVLLFSNGVFAGKDEKTILLEILIKDDEINELEIVSGAAAFRRSLPISRIKAIHVNSIELKNDIINTALAGDGGIIPEKLFKINKSTSAVFSIPALTPKSCDEIRNLNLYNRILGTFAFLANYNILLSTRTNTYKTLPDHFLIAAKVVNQNFEFGNINAERVANFYRILFKMNREEQPPLQWLISRMTEGSNFTDNDMNGFADVLYSNASSKEFYAESKELFASLSKSLERKKAIREIPKINHNDKFYLYLFAILRQYGNLSSEDKSISRADLPNLIFTSYGEYTFACLGYFYGYQALRNFEERILLNDKVFIDLLPPQPRLSLKFQLNTFFDLSIIESVYQYVFNNNDKSHLPEHKQFTHINEELIRKPNYGDQYTLEEKKLLGKVIYIVSKKSNLDQIDLLLTNMELLPALSEIGLFCNRNNLPWDTLTGKQMIGGKFRKEYFMFFRKADLLATIRNGGVDSDEALTALNRSLLLKEL